MGEDSRLAAASAVGLLLHRVARRAGVKAAPAQGHASGGSIVLAYRLAWQARDVIESYVETSKPRP